MKKIDDNDDIWVNELKIYLMQMFEKCIPAIHSFIRKKALEPITTSETELSRSLFNILSIICHPLNSFKIGQ